MKPTIRELFPRLAPPLLLGAVACAGHGASAPARATDPVSSPDEAAAGVQSACAGVDAELQSTSPLGPPRDPLTVEPIVYPENTDDWEVGTAPSQRLVGYRFTLAPEPGWTVPLLERWVDCRRAQHWSVAVADRRGTTDPLDLESIRTRVLRERGAFVVEIRSYDRETLEALGRRSRNLDVPGQAVVARQ